MNFEQIRAKQLRLAVITNLWKQGILTDEEAKELLNLPLAPDDPLTLVDDSHLLGDPEGLEKIERESER